MRNLLSIGVAIASINGNLKLFFDDSSIGFEAKSDRSRFEGFFF